MGKIVKFPKDHLHCILCKKIDFTCTKEVYEKQCKDRGIDIETVHFMCPECAKKNMEDDRYVYNKIKENKKKEQADG